MSNSKVLEFLETIFTQNKEIIKMLKSERTTSKPRVKRAKKVITRYNAYVKLVKEDARNKALDIAEDMRDTDATEQEIKKACSAFVISAGLWKLYKVQYANVQNETYPSNLSKSGIKQYIKEVEDTEREIERLRDESRPKVETLEETSDSEKPVEAPKPKRRTGRKQVVVTSDQEESEESEEESASSVSETIEDYSTPRQGRGRRSGSGRSRRKRGTSRSSNIAK